jgi:dipeptidyl aminopeptidase/acylaminoacyl peptidase
MTGLSVVGPDSYVASTSTITDPPEVITIDQGAVRRITTFTDVVEFDRPTVDEVRFAGARGDQIQMWVVTPPGGLPTPAPLAHLIHGGPHGAWTDVWHWRWHPAVFCGASRRAALVNFHGSTGWGQEFCASIRGEWGEMPTDDIEAATDRLVADGIADPERIAITGGSYGGYMVSWLVSQTDRYACGIAHAAVTNLPNMYASDITSGRGDAYGAEVWDDLDRVNKWSPAAHADGYVTPTLVIHGERDYRVPVGQGLEFYGVLRGKGVDAKLVYYPDENHWILTPANSVHWYGQVSDWLDRFIG